MPLPMVRGAAFRHALTAVLAHTLAGGPALFGRDEPVVIGIEAGEGLFGTGLDVGDHDRSARLHPAHATLTTVGSATGTPGTRAALRMRLTAGRAGGIELGAADGTVIIGVQTVEMGIGPAGHAGLHRDAALIGRDRAITIGVCARQALHALAHELGLAQPTVSVRVGAHATGRGLLCESGAGRGGERQGGEAASQKGLFHLDDLHAAKGGVSPQSGKSNEDRVRLRRATVAGPLQRPHGRRFAPRPVSP